jgi:hypothetical protein
VPVDAGGLGVQAQVGACTPAQAHRSSTRQNGRDYLVYHYYDAFSSGGAWVQIRPLIWVNGRPVTGQPMVPVPGAQS